MSTVPKYLQCLSPSPGVLGLLALALWAPLSCSPAQRPLSQAPQAQEVALPEPPEARPAAQSAAATRGGTWRSVLYPTDWVPARPDSAGRFLHDFSYAGYHRGEEPLPEAPPGRSVNALAFGADPSGARNSARAIQEALDAAGAAGGGVVLLPAGTYRVEVPANARQALWLRHPRVVLRGAGRGRTFLLCSSTGLRGKSVLRVAPRVQGSWLRPLPNTTSFLTRDLPLPTQEVPVTDAGKFRTGDWVVVRADASQAFVAEHGMAGWWAPEKQDGPTFYRQVVKVSRVKASRESTAGGTAGTLTLDAPTRYALRVRDAARVYKAAPALAEVGVEDLSIGGAQSLKAGWGDGDFSKPGTGAYDAHASSLIDLSHVLNGWVRRVASYAPPGNSGGFHMVSNGLRASRCRGLTVRECDFSHPQYRGEGGNGYGFSIGGNEGLWTELSSAAARHAFSLKGMSTSGNVLLRCSSSRPRLPTDFHMHLSMANLIDNFSAGADLLEARPRPYGSAGSRHGHTTSQSVFWNTRGLAYLPGRRFVVDSQQWGWGYVIGTRGPASAASTASRGGPPTAPEDWAEGIGQGDGLQPASLYEDQLHRRLSPR